MLRFEISLYAGSIFFSSWADITPFFFFFLEYEMIAVLS